MQLGSLRYGQEEAVGEAEDTIELEVELDFGTLVDEAIVERVEDGECTGEVDDESLLDELIVSHLPKPFRQVFASQ